MHIKIINMNQGIISKCPKCGSKLFISEFRCADCSTTISGDFGYPRLAELSEELFNFLLVFIKNRGNIKSIEKELGISYPTVRSRLDTISNLLGFEIERRREEIGEILDKLERGEITAQEAERMIKERKEV